jgi:bZIP factor
LIASTRKRRTDRESLAERVKKIKPVPDEKKDDAYWERRRKNNEAAKRSRDLRRQKEDEIALRATFLEQENLKLKAQVTILKTELSKLHYMLYNR